MHGINVPALPWPKHMQICLDMEPVRVHNNYHEPGGAKTRPPILYQKFWLDGAKIASTNFTPWTQSGWSHIASGPNFNLVMEPQCAQTRISPRHICWPFTPSPGHKAHAHSAVMALLADLVPGHTTLYGTVCRPLMALLPSTGARPICAAHP
jgi:hypothetical protein